jgi:hypothetical protein
MAETEQQRMARLLLGQGEDQLLAPPVNPMAPPQAIANVLRGVAAKAGQLATTPGTIAAGVQPQTPGQWSEEDQFRQDSLTNAPYEWAPEMAMGMAGAGGVGVPRGAVGAAGGKLVQPEGIRAYHGSPHDFERFDMSRIGTGEGAQAYGHGLYFAENPATAQSYRDALAPGFQRTLNNVPFEGLPSDAHKTVAQWMASTGAKPQEVAEIAAQRAADALKNADPSDLGRVVAETQAERHAAIAKAAREIAGTPAELGTRSKGRMYEVNINAKPEQFLDWDRPLGAQPSVQSAIPGVLEQMPRPGWMPTLKNDLKDIRRSIASDPEKDGASVWGAIKNLSSPDRATAALREAGIPGIKYLDQGSRTGGPGTSNYVVFDDKLIDILRKYGLAGASPIPPAAIAKALLQHDTTQSQ